MFKRSKRFQSFASRVSFLLLLVMMVGVLPVAPNVVEAQTELGGAVFEAGNNDSYACNWAGNAVEAAMGMLACLGYFVLKFASWVAIMSGILLNLSIEKLIVGMSDFVHPSGAANSAVEETWKIIRDLTNVFLVFLTVFIGIATIVGISGFGYKQLLWKVILAALFVNFSITLAYFVIDIGNFFAVSIYSSLLIAGGMDADAAADCIGSIADASSPGDCRTKGAAGAYVDLFAMSTLLNPNLISSDSVKQGHWIAFVTFLSGAVFMLILAFAFLAGAFLFIGRFVILIFLIIVSPIGLVAWITGVSGVGKKWWHMLINQTLIAPLLLLFWLISYLVIENFLAQGGQDRLGNLSDAINDISAFDTILVFIIGSAFLIGSVIATKSLGAAGASRALGAGKALSLGMGGLFLANTLGRFSRAVTDSHTNRKARLLETDADGNPVLQGAQYDRQRKNLGGWRDRMSQRVLSSGARANFLGTKNFDARQQGATQATTSRRRELAQTEVELNATRNAGTAVAPGATPEARRHATDQVRRLANDQLIRTVNDGTTVDENLARVMSAAQVRHLEENPDVGQDRVRAIHQFRRNEAMGHIQVGAGAATIAQRQQAIQNASRTIRNMSETERRTMARETSAAINNGTMPLAQGDIILQSMSPADVAHMDTQALTRLATSIRPEHLRALDSRNELTVPERQNLATALRALPGAGPARRYIDDARRSDLWT